MARTDTASRVIAAPRSRVFAALVDRAALLSWLPPEGMTASFERFDARAGGGYRLVLTYDDPSGAPGKATAHSDVVDARYVEIVPDLRVVQAVQFIGDDPALAGTMTMTWELSPAGDGTMILVRADDVPEGISPEDHATGINSSLEKLAAHVEAQAPRPPRVLRPGGSARTSTAEGHMGDPTGR